jgi:hypothetical protein
MTKCKLCDGRGVIWVAQPDIGGYMIEPCPQCNKAYRGSQGYGPVKEEKQDA